MYNKISKKLKREEKLEFAYRSAHMHMSFQTTFPMPLEQIIQHILRARCLNTVHPHRDTRRSHVHNWQRRLYFCYFDARVRRPAGKHSLYYPFNGVYYPFCHMHPIGRATVYIYTHNTPSSINATNRQPPECTCTCCQDT